MHRDTAQAIWYRKLDRNCFSAEDTAATEQQHTPAPAGRSRWFPRFTATSASEEWRPLAEDRRRWAVEAAGDSAY
jgi:hypothetical protein